MNTLKDFVYFHDWQIDTLAVQTGNRLVLELSLEERRAVVVFVGTSRCAVEHFGLLNIVREIRVLKPEDVCYPRAQSLLAKSDRYSKAPAPNVALVAATAGAEITVEFDALEIEER